MSTCIYMADISINDNLIMVKAIHHWLVTVIKLHQWQPLECEFSAFIVFVALQNSTFQLINLLQLNVHTKQHCAIPQIEQK